MFKIELLNNYKNAGQNAEQSLAYALTGEIRKHDKVAFDKGSDIPEFKMSVKSARFTLASALNGESYEEMKADFFSRCASEILAYVTKSGEVYMMTSETFGRFLDAFASVGYSSSKNGHHKIIRMRSESKEVLNWLAALNH